LAPLARLDPALLGELALRAGEPRLALHVELPGRELEQRVGAHRLPRLAHEVEPLSVVGDDRDRARMPDDLPGRERAVRVAELVDAHARDPPLVDDPRGDALHRPPPPAARAAMRSQTASIWTIRSPATLSSGVWFASVPLASSTHSKPRAASAFASLPPPVATSAGVKPQSASACRARLTGRDEAGRR